MIMRALACTGALALAGILLSAPPADAQLLDSDVTIASEIQYAPWKNMTHESFRIDIDDMDDRCSEGAAETSVTADECLDAKKMLQAGQCPYVAVPDGVPYEFLRGLLKGKPHVYTNMVKRLGVTRMAYSCTVSTGRVIDWYVGEDKVSCGNVAARPLPSKPTQLKEEVPEEVEYEWIQVCERVPFQSVARSSPTHIHGFALETCGHYSHYFPGTTIQWDDTIRSSGWTNQCHTIKRRIER